MVLYFMLEALDVQNQELSTYLKSAQRTKSGPCSETDKKLVTVIVGLSLNGNPPIKTAFCLKLSKNGLETFIEN